jgi:thiamine transport system substrate-binding protein
MYRCKCLFSRSTLKQNLPQEFIDYAQIPDQPAEIDLDEIAANRERWIQEWDEVVLR